MIKVKQMEKKDTKFLDSNLKIFWKNYAKPLIILVFSCCYPIMIFLASFQDISKLMRVITCHIFWVKSWGNLKKVFIIILYSFKYYEYKNKFFCRGRYYCAKKENKHYLLFKRKSI